MTGTDGNPWCPLTVNGAFNSATIHALQTKLNMDDNAGLDVDGVYGTKTVAALRYRIQGPTGQLSPGNNIRSEAVKQLQRRIVSTGFTVDVDGWWGPRTTSGLQLSICSTRF